MQPETLLTMSAKDIQRLEILQQIDQRKLKHSRAAEILGISTRQIKRLRRQYKLYGAQGIISKRRGKCSNNKLPGSVKELAITLIQEHYNDFGPTFACEKITEVHGIKVSVGTIRKWMMEALIWIPRDRRIKKIHQPRYRRSCYGELVQIDGSEHDRFEGRGSGCTLLVYVDDATSKLMELRFVPEESTFTYFEQCSCIY